MSLQSMEQVLPVLQLMEQPAFCIRQDGSVVCNPPARQLAPAAAEDLPQWLGDSTEAYKQWDRSTKLTLPLRLFGLDTHVTVCALSDGTLFLLSQQGKDERTPSLSGVTAQVMRIPLTDLSSMSSRLAEELEEYEDPLLQEQTAAISRQLYRMTRLACNLADLDTLRSGSYPVNREKLELLPFLQEITLELEDLFSVCQRSLQIRLPSKPITLTADPILLKRGIFNLVSNALKYGNTDAPVHFMVDVTATAVLFRIRNTCVDPESDLLTAAFRRTQERGLIPDPRWGLGLGLPIARHIAQLMGGTVAVELADGVASVTMSISRKRMELDSAVHTPSYDYTGGMRLGLLELADSLPAECFDSMVL